MKTAKLLALISFSIVAIHAHAHAESNAGKCMGVARVAPMVAQARDAGVLQSDIVRGMMSSGLEWPIKPSHSRTERDLINMVGAVYHDPRYVKGVAPAQVSAWAYADCVNDKGGH